MPQRGADYKTDGQVKHIDGRLELPDLANLLDAPDTDEARRLAGEISALRNRLAQIEADYDAGHIDGRRYAVATEKVQAQLTAAEVGRARAVGGSVLGTVLNAPDPALAFDSAPLGTQRAVLDLLATVTLHPARRGHKFDPETVQIEWATHGGQIP